MSAFPIALALPQARGADAASGKAVDADGGGEADRNRFADLFRDIGREIADAGRPAADAATSGATEPAAGDTPFQSLADALAGAGKGRLATADGERAPHASQGEGAAQLTTPQDGKAARTTAANRAAASHAAMRQSLAAAAAKLLSAADSAKAQATQDAALDQIARDAQGLPGDAAANAQIEADLAQAAKIASRKQALGAPASGHGETARAEARRLPGNQGLTALLFGRTETAGTDAADTASTPAAEDSAPEDTAADAAPVTAQARADAAALAMPSAMPLPPAARPAESAEVDPDHQPATGRESLGGTAATSETPASAGPMRITILSRETHFAPIRTLALNGASAPERTGPAAPAAADGATASSAPAPTSDPRHAATAGAARVLAGQAGGTAAIRAATPLPTGSTRATATAVPEPVAAASDAPARVTPRTPGRESARTGDARQSGHADAAEAAHRDGSAATTETGTTDRAQSGETATTPSAAQDAPLTGVAAIGGSSQPAGPAPALATLRQIGAAIAAEAGSMGATSSIEGPTANLIAGPVRLLDIQLSPDDLGTVNVRMRLSGNGLEIRLRASNAETAKMLERDQTALLDLLAASGITADSITIVGGDGAGLAQLTGQDAGRPFTAPQPPAGEGDAPREQGNRDPQGRSSGDDRQKGQSRDDQARSPGRAFDLGGGFRV